MVSFVVGERFGIRSIDETFILFKSLVKTWE